MVIAEVSELPVAGLVVQVGQGLLVPLHRDVSGPHHLVPPHCLNPHLILTSASASDHLGAEHQHSEIKIQLGQLRLIPPGLGSQVYVAGYEVA